MNEPFDNSAKAFYQKLFEGWGILIENDYKPPYFLTSSLADTGLLNAQSKQ